VIELGWRPAKVDTYVSTARLRAGWHVLERLLGDDLARQEGVSPGTHPFFASLYFGKQGPVPALPWRRIVYTRAAIGASMYLGQSLALGAAADSAAEVEPSTPVRFAAGAEVAFGFHYPNGVVRPWLEVRTGMEHILEVGSRWARPLFMIGLELDIS
jgi:hypothetical protein